MIVDTDALVYAGLDLPSVKPSVTAAAHADTPTSYADINFTAMNKSQKSASSSSEPAGEYAIFNIHNSTKSLATF